MLGFIDAYSLGKCLRLELKKVMSWISFRKSEVCNEIRGVWLYGYNTISQIS